MKKIILIIASFSVCIGLTAQTVKLPAPKKDASMTLYQALQQRASNREFSEKAVPDQILSSGDPDRVFEQAASIALTAC